MRFLIGLLALFGVATAASAQNPPSPPTDAKPIPAAPALDPQNVWVIDLTSGGRVKVLLRPDKAPGHVERIKTLTRQGFYNGLIFHRVIDGFMAQGGDPTGTGTSGSKLPDLKAEFNDLPHVRGAVSAARTDKDDTANSQFFIMFLPRLSLDGKYTVFGRVIAGMDVVDGIQRGEPPENPTRIARTFIESDGEPPMPVAPKLPLEVPTTAPTPATTPSPVPTPQPAPVPPR